MTKAQLIERIAEKITKINIKDIDTVVSAVFDKMTQSLAAHNRIEIRGFGSFVAKNRKARIARNPKTGTQVQVPKKAVPFFTAGKELRQRVNKAI